ncbi:MAG: 2-hydroxyacyl-CoA dehydratase [Peptococcaceae bacterium]|nr:2-hydroxyacyl-CoA dehydratase [Peptococcaceae bacterium]
MTFEEILETEKKQYPEDKRPVVGWLCSYTPEEIIEAAGFRPYRILPRSNLSPSIDSYITGNLCSRVKNCLGYALSGRYDFMRGIVTTFSCNALTHMYNIWKEYIGDIFVYNIEIPAHRDKEACAYLQNELAKMFAALADRAGVRPDYRALYDAVLARLETMQLLNRMQALRIRDNPPLTGLEAIKITEMASTVPRSIFNTALRRYLATMEQKTEPDRSNTRPRILITGGFIPRFLVAMVEEYGGLVVAEDGCNGYRHFAGIPQEEAGGSEDAENCTAEKQLLQLLANRHLKRPPCARMHGATVQRSQEISRLAGQYKAAGIIHYSLKFCDCNIYEFPVLKDKAAELGVPFLHLEGEEHNTGTGQLETRLQAFLEIVSNFP